MPRFIKGLPYRMLLRSVLVIFALASCLCAPAPGADVRVEYEKFIDLGKDFGRPRSADRFVVVGSDRALGVHQILERALREYKKMMSATATLEDNGNPLNILDDEIVRTLAMEISIHAEGGLILEELKNYCNGIKEGQDPQKTQQDIYNHIENSLARLRYSLRDKGLGVLSINATWPITRLLLYGVQPFDPDDMTKLRRKMAAVRMTANTLQEMEILALFAKLCDFKDTTVGHLQEKYKELLEKSPRQDAIQYHENNVTFPTGIAVQGQDITEVNNPYAQSLVTVGKTPYDRTAENRAIDQMEAARKGVFENLVKRGKGIVGFSGDAAKETVFTRTRSIAFIILYSAFFLRIFYIMLAKLTGNVGWGGISPMALVFKMIMLTVVILAVPNIAMFGMNVSDSARNHILDHSGKNPDFSPAQNTVLLSNNLADISRAAAAALGGREDIRTRSWIMEFVLQGIAYICSVLVSAVLGTMLILGDVMFGIVCVTAPLILAMSIVPSCENWLAQLAGSYVGFLLYGPMAALYMMVMAIAAVAYPSATMLIFITLSIIYVKITSRLPDMCEGMSALAVSAVVTAISAMPANTAKKTLKTAGGYAAGSVRRLIGAGSGGGKK